MSDITHGVDVRDIPLSEFPTPIGRHVDNYVWEMGFNHLALHVPGEEYFRVTYDIPGGYISGHAETEVFAFFVDALREVTSRYAAHKTVPSGPPAEVSESPV